MRVLFSLNLLFVSKPRCGSTSVRRVLDPLVDRACGDLAVDVAGQYPPYHPHHSAPYIKRLLKEDARDISKLVTFITVRHPVEMLWSYYKYFKPNIWGKYNYQEDWTDYPIPFNEWVLNGRVGMNADALAMAPKWISTSNLSPLSLEAHSLDRDNASHVDKVFQIEDFDALRQWLCQKTGKDLPGRHVNESISAERPDLDPRAVAKIRSMFPAESKLYQV